MGRIAPEERAWIDRIEQRRSEIASEETIAKLAPASGASGSRPQRPVHERVAGLSVWCRSLSIPPVWGAFLMRLIRELQPRSCLELGTGLGMSAAYQAAALELNGAGTLTTMDHAAKAGVVLGHGLASLGLSDRVDFQLGPISDKLESVLERIAPVDFAFLDAEHTEQATLAHFHTMLPYLAGGAVVLLDDIHWSKEMKRAWRRIKLHPRISVGLGLRRMGVAVIAPDTNEA